MTIAGLRRHDGANQDGNENARENQEQANVGYGRQGAVGEHDDKTGKPGDDEVYDEDVPAFVGVPFMEETVHADNLVGEDGGDGSGAKDPA